MDWDIDMFRRILTRLEQYNETDISKSVQEHVRLLVSGRFIEGSSIRDGSDVVYINMALTYEGYELLSSLSNAGVWEDVKEQLRSDGLEPNEVPLSIIKQLADKNIKERLHL